MCKYIFVKSHFIYDKFGELPSNNLGVYAVKTRNFCRDSPAIWRRLAQRWRFETDWKITILISAKWSAFVSVHLVEIWWHSVQWPRSLRHKNLQGCRSLWDRATCPPIFMKGDINGNRARQLYKNISMLFLFPVKTVSLVQASFRVNTERFLY